MNGWLLLAGWLLAGVWIFSPYLRIWILTRRRPDWPECPWWDAPVWLGGVRNRR